MNDTERRRFCEARITRTASCWIWTGSKSGEGYGRVYIAGKHYQAHRLVYELTIGPIPPELTLDHLCSNPSCVNPDHLEPVPIRENILRGITSAAAVNARKTHCDHGHEFTPENTYLHRGRRICRACNRDSVRAYDARIKSQTTQ